MLQGIKKLIDRSIFGKLVLSFLLVFMLSAFVACGSDDDDDDDGIPVPTNTAPATSLGANLNITGTITHTFDTSPFNWEENYTHPNGMDYHIVDDTTDKETQLVTDGDDNNELDLTYGNPPVGDLTTADQWNLTSDPSDAKFYFVCIENDDEDQISEGNFDINTLDYAEYYYYVHVNKDATLSGSTSHEDETYTFLDTELSAGWNEVIVRTNGTIYYYYGGTLTDPKWKHIPE